jgi:2-polyprenyl-3-methyl-5-hydroxy-6-metoxy-1,4-benzoquinol methylase
VARAENEAEVLAYYTTTPHYLYELSYWEASADKQAWFRVIGRACERYRVRRMVDFGGGVGGLCRALQGRGISCDYLDVAGNTFNYATWRFRRLGLSVQTFNALNGWPAPRSYDVVTAWDVLEHLFDLEDTIKKIAQLLRPGGWFLSKSTFAVEGGHHLDIHLAKHACYADVKRLNELLSQSGFVFRGQLKPSRLSRLLRIGGLRHAVAGIRIAPRLKHGGNFLVHERRTP